VVAFFKSCSSSIAGESLTQKAVVFDKPGVDSFHAVGNVRKTNWCPCLKCRTVDFENKIRIRPDVFKMSWRCGVIIEL
jgi:hypothetical protein